jgi:hypothetical protein
MRLGSQNLARARKRGRIPIVVTCNERCSALVRLRIKGSLAKRLGLAKLVVIARAKGTVAANKKTALRAKLTKRTRRALRGRRALRLTLRGTFTDAAGNATALTRRAVLKRPRR